MYKSGSNFIYLLFYAVIANNFVFGSIGTQNNDDSSASNKYNASDIDDQKLNIEDYNEEGGEENSLLVNRNQFNLNFNHKNHNTSYQNNSNRSDKLDEYVINNDVWIDVENITTITKISSLSSSPATTSTATTSNFTQKGNLDEFFSRVNCQKRFYDI